MNHTQPTADQLEKGLDRALAWYTTPEVICTGVEQILATAKAFADYLAGNLSEGPDSAGSP